MRDWRRRLLPASKEPTISELTKGRDLGAFLRARRSRLDPDDLGLPPRRRRGPGLSREEVAYLAGISADWYGRLELGRESNPSRATLGAIADVFRLTDAERAFVFDLVGLADPRDEVPADNGRSDVLDRLIFDPLRVGICVGDQFLTPIRWNAIADAWWGLSGFPTAEERNIVSRFDEPFLIQLGGEHYEAIARAIVGMFRRAHVSSPTPFSQHILDVAMRKPLFRLFWDEHGIADQPWDSGGPHVREHPMVGAVNINAVLLEVPLSPEIIVAVAPADVASEAVFDRLREIGSDSRSVMVPAGRR